MPDYDALAVAADLLEERGMALASQVLRAASRHNDVMGAAPSWLRILCHQYEEEHDWEADEDPSATREMLTACKDLALSIELSIPIPCQHEWEETGGSSGPESVEKFVENRSGRRSHRDSGVA